MKWHLFGQGPCLIICNYQRDIEKYPILGDFGKVLYPLEEEKKVVPCFHVQPARLRQDIWGEKVGSPQPTSIPGWGILGNETPCIYRPRRSFMTRIVARRPRRRRLPPGRSPCDLGVTRHPSGQDAVGGVFPPKTNEILRRAQPRPQLVVGVILPLGPGQARLRSLGSGMAQDSHSPERNLIRVECRPKTRGAVCLLFRSRRAERGGEGERGYCATLSRLQIID